MMKNNLGKLKSSMLPQAEAFAVIVEHSMK